MTVKGTKISSLRSFVCGLVLLSAFFTPLFSQTLFWTENFNNGCATGCLANTYSGPNGAWTVANTGVNEAFANQWYISCEETGFPAGTCGAGCGGNPCGSGCGNNPTLHVGSVPGSPAGLCPRVECGAAYDASNTVATNRRAESPVINCAAFQNITVSFNFIGEGQPGVDECQFQYSSDGGTTWTTLQAGFSSGCCCLLAGFCGGPDPIPCSNFFAGQGYWAAATINLPASADFNGNVKIGFNWTNNSDNLGSDPSFAVDAVELRGFSILSQELNAFRGLPSAEGNLLEWDFEPAKRPEKVVLERSEDGSSFYPVFSELPHSKTAENQWLDEQPEATESWYRLKTTFPDGQEALSAPILVENSPFFADHFTTFPNPVKCGEPLFFEAGEAENLSIEIYGADGKRHFSRTFNPNQDAASLFIDTSNLPNGIFFLKANLDGKVVRRKLVIQ